jgi:hypothetical protein
MKTVERTLVRVSVKTMELVIAITQSSNLRERVGNQNYDVLSEYNSYLLICPSIAFLKLFEIALLSFDGFHIS